jgi:hypothetical protein
VPPVTRVFGCGRRTIAVLFFATDFADDFAGALRGARFLVFVVAMMKSDR